jgi:ascorbate-specific PTS system EIIC-type component UlaA
MLYILRLSLCSLVAFVTFIAFLYLAGVMLVVANRTGGDVGAVLAVMSLGMVVIGVAMSVVNFAEVNDLIRRR